jgi:hypothetical protein
LAVLRVERDKCGRSGQYRVDRLIMRYGMDAKHSAGPTRSRPIARGVISDDQAHQRRKNPSGCPNADRKSEEEDARNLKSHGNLPFLVPH